MSNSLRLAGRALAILLAIIVGLEVSGKNVKWAYEKKEKAPTKVGAFSFFFS
jgi:hypothetical protein